MNRVGMSAGYSAYKVSEITGIPLSQLRYLEMEFSDMLGTSGVHSTRGHQYTEERVAVVRKLHDLRFNRRLTPPAIRHALREESTRKRGHVLAVTSGKGGVGKTTVAVNLATTFAAMHRRTLLVDCDLGLANVHVLTGIKPARTLLDFINGVGRLEEAIVKGPGGVDIICGGSGEKRLADLDARWMEHLQNELSRHFSSYDDVVLDTGAGISSQVLRFLGMADEILVTLTPNLSAILDAYGMVKTVRQEKLKGRVHLLVNQVRDEQQGIQVAERIQACARRFLEGVPDYVGYLLDDPAVEDSHQNRQALVLGHPQHKNSRLFAELARRLGTEKIQPKAVKADLAAAAAG
jgi:flagellar biosynthesis protein FlhG